MKKNETIDFDEELATFIELSDPEALVRQVKGVKKDKGIEVKHYKKTILPKTEIEKVLVGIWEELFKIKNVGVNYNFFSLGGTSLLATQVMLRIRNLQGIEVPLNDVLKYPVLKNLANTITEKYLSKKALPSITRVNDKKKIPLSFAQQRLWFIEQLVGSSNLYHLHMCLKLTGALDESALKKALNCLVERHETLRTKIVTVDGIAYQEILPEFKFKLEEKQLENIKSSTERENCLLALIRQEIVDPFDFEKEPLCRGLLVKVTGKEHILLFVFHHSIIDDWSFAVLGRELSKCYESFSRNQSFQLDRLPVQYKDYSVWQRDWLQGEVLEKQLEYWKKELHEAPYLSISTDKDRPKEQNYDGEIYRAKIPKEVLDSLNQLSRKKEVTLFMVLLTAFQGLLARYTNQNDIVVGTPIANRRTIELEGLIGFFINTLVIRTSIEHNPIFVELLKRVEETTLLAYEHQDIPFEHLVEHLNIQRDLSRHPLFQVMFVLKDEKDRQIKLGDLGVFPLDVDVERRSRFDLTLELIETHDGMKLSFEYATAIFNRESIERLANYYIKFVEAIANNPKLRISEISIFGKEELAILESLNQTESFYPRDKTIQKLFEEQAEMTPDNVAVVYKDEEITYRELNKKANYFAHFLRAEYKKRIGKELDIGTLIGIYIERSVEMVVGMLGILKAGAAYVPLDINYPRERLYLMLKTIQAPLLVTQQKLREVFSDCPIEILTLDFVREDVESSFAKNPELRTTPDDFIYILFTSGSTGFPKASGLYHKGISNLLYFYTTTFKMGPKDKNLITSSFGFDLTQKNILGGLLSGGQVHLLETQHYDPKLIGEVIKREAITLMNCTPSAFYPIVEETEDLTSLRSLRYVFLGGESINTSRLKPLLKYCPKVEVVNTYGPTECSDLSCVKVLSREDIEENRKIPVGKPVQNTQLFILDQNKKVVPFGQIGEGYIGGVGIGSGYVSDQKLTQEKFIENPLLSDREREERRKKGEETRVYRIGDLLRYLPNGEVEFIGRVDNQVKLRGLRIELGEIESVLGQYDGIEECVVVIKEGKEDQKILVAYYALSEIDHDLTSERRLTIEELRHYLGKRLPDYMIPSIFVELEEFSLTPNDKIDRNALPDPSEMDYGLEGAYIAPRDDTERKLSAIWSKVLKVDRIGINDNFFSLGGDSIMSIQVVSRAREAGLEITPKRLFSYPTISELARDIRERKGSERIEIEQGLVKGEALLTPIQRWFFKQDIVNYNHFNQANLFCLNEPVDKDTLRKILEGVVRHHNELGMRYKKNKEENRGDKKDRENEKENRDKEDKKELWIQSYLPEGRDFSVEVEEIDLKGLSSEEANRKIEAKNTRLQSSLNIENGPILRAGLYSGHYDGRQRLFLVIHHLVVDGVSWRILQEDIERIYVQLSKGGKGEVNLPLKTSSYQIWGEALKKYAESEDLAKEWNYWLLVGREGSLLPMDKDDLELDVNKERILHYTTNLTEEETKLLLNHVPQAYQTQINDILLSALALSTWKWTGANDLLLHLEGHGREDCIEGVDVSRTVGWFTSLFPVHLKLPGESDLDECCLGKEGLDKELYLSEVIKSIKEQLRSIPHKGIGYGILRYLSQDKRAKELEANDKARISFNYLGQMDTGVDEEELLVSAEESVGRSISGKNCFGTPIEINGLVKNNCLFLSFDYSCLHYNEKTIEGLANKFNSFLRLIITHCTNLEKRVYTPSDFPLAEVSQKVLDDLTRDRIGINSFAEIEGLYQLTPLQEGLLFHALYAPESDQYCTQKKWEYEGKLDHETLKKAWDILINRHSIFRTRFVWEDLEKPVQVVQRHVAIPWAEEDWRKYSEEDEKEQKERLERYLNEDRQRGFSLGNPCLMRLYLIRLEDERYLFVWTDHHILLDGWCLPVLFKEINDIYKKLLQGDVVALSDTPSYERYIEWLQKQNRDEAKKYWREELKGIEEPAHLGETRGLLGIHQPIKDLKEEVRYFTGELTESCTKFAKKHRITLSTLLEFAWGMVLSRYSSQEDLLLGTVVSGRPGELSHVEDMVGLFINALPIRLKIDRNRSVKDHLLDLHERIQLSNQYSYLSLNEIQLESDIPKEQPLFYSLFAFENYPLSEEKGVSQDTGLTLEMKNFSIREKSNYPLAIVVMPGKRIMLKIAYNGLNFTKEEISQRISHIENILKWVIGHSESKITETELLGEEERQEILFDWNKTKAPYPHDKVVSQLFEDQVASTPENIAIRFEGKEKLTYKELNEKTNQLARYLRKEYMKLTGKELQRNSLIGICMERSVEMIIGILGVLKAGGAYVPLDSQYPEERLKFMVSDAGMELVLTQTDILGRISSLQGEIKGETEEKKRKVICLDRDWLEIEKEESDNLQRVNYPTDLAYVIYTSGSTGQPKGTLVSHSGLCNLITFVRKNLGVNEEDRVLQFSSISFDASVMELIASLFNGAQLCLVSDEKILAGEVLSEVICEHGITIITFPSSVLETLPVNREYPLKKVILGGDVPKTHVVEGWRNKVDLMNTYGATELSVCVSMIKYGEGLSAKTAGKPFMNIAIYILDRYMQPVPTGVVGEIYVGGVGIAKGYLNRKELTKERFIDNPFIEEEADENRGECKEKDEEKRKGSYSYSEKIYRTGDFGLYLPDGNIEVLGRLDHQIKIRGFRVELGEIENVLSHHERIQQSVVIVDDVDGTQRLVSYYASDEGTDKRTEDEIGLTTEELRHYLGKRLPDYMVPSIFIKLEELPLTPHGKIDRKALPDPSEMDYGLEGAYIAPRDDIERKLSAIWIKVLKVDRIGVDDNFFSLGGDSIMSIQVVSRAREAGLEITPKRLFSYPTISELARDIRERKGSERIEIEQGLVKGGALSTPIQTWFFRQDIVNYNHFNQASLFCLNEPVDKDTLSKILESVVRHHDALRMRYKTEEEYSEDRREEKELWIQDFSTEKEAFSVEIEEIDLEGLSSEEANRKIEAKNTQLQSSLNIENGPILRAGLYRGHYDGRQRLFLVIHHLVVDGVSWRILQEDIERIYAQLSKGGKGEVNLPLKTGSYQIWGEALKKYAESEDLAKEWDYWLLVGREGSLLPMDKDDLESDVNKERILHYTTNLTEEETKLLLNHVPQAYQTQINDILLSALALSTWKWTGAKDLLLHLEGHGREDCIEGVDVSRTIGWFTSLFPVHLKLPDGKNFGERDLNKESLDREKYLSEVIKGIKEQLRSIPHKGIGYGILRYLSQDKRSKELEVNDRARISFNYLGQMDAGIDECGLLVPAKESIGRSTSEKNRFGTLIGINGLVKDGRFFLSFDHSCLHYNRETVENLAENFKLFLRLIIKHCTNLERKVYTPSDFPLAVLTQEVLDGLTKEKEGINSGKEIDAIYHLNPLQEGLLFHALYAPESDQYCTQTTWNYKGEIQPEVLRGAWERVIKKHNTFRTRFVWEGLEKPIQVVQKQIQVYWVNEDWQGCSEEEQKEKLERCLKEDRLKRFDLSQPCLMRMYLIRRSEDRYIFIWTHHHILLDGWCFPILLKELKEGYDDILKGRPARRAEVPTYMRYIEWLDAQDKNEAKKYWKEELKGITGPTNLGINKRPLGIHKPISNLREEEYYFTEEFTRLCIQFVRKYRVTLSTLLELAWGTVLSRYSNEENVILGTIVSGRPGELAQVENMVGLFINALPIRLKIDKSKTTKDHLLDLHERIQLSNHYSYLSLNDIQLESEISNDLPLFYSLFLFENYPIDEKVEEGRQKAEGLAAKNFHAYEKTNYPLMFTVIPGKRLMLKISYDGLSFEEEDIKRQISHIENVVKWVIEHSEESLSHAELLGVEEREKILLNWNRTETVYEENETIPQLFERQVEKTPDNIAVQYEDESITYRELNQRANQLAHYLKKHGIEKEDPIPICINRSLEMIIGMLGILKAGGAYVPIDIYYPKTRIKNILKDINPRLIISQKEHAKILEEMSVEANERKIIFLDHEQNKLNTESTSNPNTELNKNNLAYIIYTSGSTGKPKGVMIENKALINLVVSMRQQCFQCNTKETLLAVTPISFDISGLEFYVPLLYGMRCVVCPQDVSLDAALLKKYIEDHKITIMQATPVTWKMLCEERWENKEGIKILCGGEALDNKLATQLVARAADIWNLYGPTETTIWSGTYKINKENIGRRIFIPIGKPILNTQFYVLNKDMQIVPPNIIGELYIGGLGLARGYFKDLDTTKEKFIENPFLSLREKEMMQMRGEEICLYRTGDLVRCLSDENFEFINRADYQVKLRGFRIELGEIEAVLGQHKQIAQCAVIMKDDSKNNQKKLIAYYVLSEELEKGENKDELTIDGLREYLSKRLPGYMIPSVFVSLDKMPLTSNGKIDRKILLKKSYKESLKLESGYVPPRNKTEQILAKIWKEVLKIDLVGINDNFFSLGGNSLVAMQLTSKIKYFLYSKTMVKEIFQYPTISSMSAYLNKYIDQIKDAQEEHKESLLLCEKLVNSTMLYLKKNKITFLDAIAVSYLRDFNLGIVKRRDALKVIFPDDSLYISTFFTPIGTIGVLVLPLFGDELYIDKAFLSNQIQAIQKSADELGVKAISLMGNIPSATDYGDAIETGDKIPPITTGHAVTISAVCLNTKKIIELTGVVPKTVGFLGLGSIGSVAMMLLLKTVLYPEKIILCDIQTKLSYLEELKKEIYKHTKFAGEIIVLESKEKAPEDFYQSSLIIGATTVPNILEVEKLRSGTIIVDDSAPHCFEEEDGWRRLKERKDILFTEGGPLKSPFLMKLIFRSVLSFEEIRNKLYFSYDKISVNKTIKNHPLTGDRTNKIKADEIIEGEIMGCILASLLTSKFSDFPIVRGLVPLKVAEQAYKKLLCLGFHGVDLQWSGKYLQKDIIEEFQNKFGSKK